MLLIAQTVHGSHLYGTDTPTSDRDFKRIVIPSAEAILLQRAKDSSRETSKQDNSVKNTIGDVDVDIWTLQKFFSLCAQGQTNALEVLFTPPWFLTQTTYEWENVVLNSSKLVSRKIGAFLGYCQQQAAKYGIKGSRVAAMERASMFFALQLTKHPGHTKIEVVVPEFEEAMAGVEHVCVETLPHPSNPLAEIKHVKVCDTRMPTGARLKDAYETFTRVWENYGERARKAQANEGIDWKAVSHAVRVGHQAIELLETGRLQFPRPERFHLLDIKQGRIAYPIVAEEIEALVDDVRSAHARSLLPDEPDLEWMQNTILRHYGKEVERWASIQRRDGS